MCLWDWTQRGTLGELQEGQGPQHHSAKLSGACVADSRGKAGAWQLG